MRPAAEPRSSPSRSMGIQRAQPAAHGGGRMACRFGAGRRCAPPPEAEVSPTAHIAGPSNCPTSQPAQRTPLPSVQPALGEGNQSTSCWDPQGPQQRQASRLANQCLKSRARRWRQLAGGAELEPPWAPRPAQVRRPTRQSRGWCPWCRPIKTAERQGRGGSASRGDRRGINGAVKGPWGNPSFHGARGQVWGPPQHVLPEWMNRSSNLQGLGGTGAASAGGRFLGPSWRWGGVVGVFALFNRHQRTAGGRTPIRALGLGAGAVSSPPLSVFCCASGRFVAAGRLSAAGPRSWASPFGQPRRNQPPESNAALLIDLVRASLGGLSATRPWLAACLCRPRCRCRGFFLGAQLAVRPWHPRQLEWLADHLRSKCSRC